MPEAASEYSYDAFISYSHTDAAWVHDWLLPHLEQAGLTICIDIRDFDIGLPSIVNREQAVERSRRTIIVMTPAWVASEWTDFEALLTQTSDPAGRRRRIIPLLLQPCQPPSRIAMLTYADFTKEPTREAQLQRVISAIRGGATGASVRPILQHGRENTSSQETPPPPAHAAGEWSSLGST